MTVFPHLSPLHQNTISTTKIEYAYHLLLPIFKGLDELGESRRTKFVKNKRDDEKPDMPGKGLQRCVCLPNASRPGDSHQHYLEDLNTGIIQNRYDFFTKKKDIEAPVNEISENHGCYIHFDFTIIGYAMTLVEAAWPDCSELRGAEMHGWWHTKLRALAARLMGDQGYEELVKSLRAHFNDKPKAPKKAKAKKVIRKREVASRR